MITSYRPASSETCRVAQSSRRQISSSMASMDGAMVGSPTQAEPLPSAVRAHQVHRSRRLEVGEPHARRAAQVQRGEVELREARQHGVAGRAPGRRRPTVPTARLRGPRSPSPRAPARSRVRRPRLARLDEGKRVLGRWRRSGVGQRRRHHLVDARPTPRRPSDAAADRSRHDRDDADGSCPVHAVGRGRVRPRSGRRRGCPPRPAPGSRRHPRVRGGDAPLDQLLGRDHRRLRARSPSRLLAGVEHAAPRARAPRGTRATPAPPARAAPCRS